MTIPPEQKLVLDSLSRKIGVSKGSLDELLDGRASTAIAEKLRVSPVALQDFIDGHTTSPALANVLGVSVQATAELRTRVGREGAVGLIVGLCLERRR